MKKRVSINIAELVITPAVEFKIRRKYHVTSEEVRAELVMRPNLQATSIFDLRHGFRYTFLICIGGKKLHRVFIDQVDKSDDIWSLRTVIPVKTFKRKG